MGKHTHLTLFEEVYRGLVARVNALPGSWLVPTLHADPEFKYASDDKTLTLAKMAVRRSTKTKGGRDAVVQIALRMKWESGSWVNKYGSLHCGPDPDDMTLVYFRIDNEGRPDAAAKHCHIKGYGPKPEKGGHIPFATVIPPPTLDPNDFMTLVERFIATDEIPLKVRK